MNTLESLEKIRPIWLHRTSTRLASGEELRDSLRESLDRFYELMITAVEIGDPTNITPVLDEWVETRTRTDLVSLESNLANMLNQLLLISLEVVGENYQLEDAYLINLAILPIFLEGINYASQKETELQVQHIANDLELANTTLARLDKSKSDFIAIAAHELKTPLTLIEGYCSMLREQVSESENNLQVEILLKGIDNGAYRLREIVNDMVDVSLIDNDLLSLHFQPIWINQIIRVLEKEFEKTINERRITLDVQPFQGSGEMTFGDAERLFQAFRNVISNAIKFTPDDGKIIVDGRKLPGFIEITVSDTGIGIDPDDQTRIFEKFGRLGSVSLHSSGKTKYKGGGPGLGLPITKGIIEAHGGAIWVESDRFDEYEFPGSTFHILLPMLETPPDDRSAKLFSPLKNLNT